MPQKISMIAICAVLLAACGPKGPPQGGGMPPAPVTVQEVALRSFPVEFEYPAQTAGSREVEVLQLVAEGWPPAEVARRLFISRKTVSSHIQRIFVKLDVHTRAQAVAGPSVQGAHCRGGGRSAE